MASPGAGGTRQSRTREADTEILVTRALGATWGRVQAQWSAMHNRMQIAECFANLWRGRSGMSCRWEWSQLLPHTVGQCDQWSMLGSYQESTGKVSSSCHYSLIISPWYLTSRWGLSAASLVGPSPWYTSCPRVAGESLKPSRCQYWEEHCVELLPVKTWPHNFSSFWHCSSNFLLDMWAFLR